MKTICKICLATVIALFVTGLAWSSPSEAYRGGHYRGNYRGNYRGGHKNYHKLGIKGYGHRRQLPYGTHRYKHRYRHKPRYSHRGRLGRYQYGLGIHLGHGYHTFYRSPYPYRYGYFYKPFSYPYRYGYFYNLYPYRCYDPIPYYYPGSYGQESYSTGDGSDDLDEGWNLLRRGKPAEAVDAFGRLAQASPSEGMPKVGYALAAAELGRLDKGIWAMRRALREDPESLQYVTIDQQLQPKVKAMIKRYQQSGMYDDSSDGAFMVAVLHYLLGNMDAAQKAVERHSNSSDTYTSVVNLKRLIAQESKPDFE